MIRHRDAICTIVAADQKAGEFGIAVAAGTLAVGKTVPFTGAFVGAIAVQGYSSPYFGIAGMKLLREGVSSAEVVERILAGDPLKEHRQIAAIDAAGKTFVFTGSNNPPIAGAHQGANYAVAAAGLSSQDVIDACAKAFETANGDLAARLLAAIAAASQKSSGDVFESAAVRISRDEPYPHLDLRVDQHPSPVSELAKLLDVSRKKNNSGPH